MNVREIFQRLIPTQQTDRPNDIKPLDHFEIFRFDPPLSLGSATWLRVWPYSEEFPNTQQEKSFDWILLKLIERITLSPVQQTDGESERKYNVVASTSKQDFLVGESPLIEKDAKLRAQKLAGLVTKATSSPIVK
jgi:hypothetical protein